MNPILGVNSGAFYVVNVINLISCDKMKLTDNTVR
jgi:hypothetical protein